MALIIETLEVSPGHSDILCRQSPRKRIKACRTPSASPPQFIFTMGLCQNSFPPEVSARVHFHLRVAPKFNLSDLKDLHYNATLWLHVFFVHHGIVHAWALVHQHIILVTFGPSSCYNFAQL